MLPGMKGHSAMLENSEEEFKKVEAMILSMTPEERMCKRDLMVGRRQRIARGSGTGMYDVNKLVKSFKKAKQFFKNAPKTKQLEKMMGSLQS